MREPSATRRHTPLAQGCGQPHSCPEPVRLRVLGRVPYFRGLSEQQLRVIDGQMQSLAWAEGEHLYAAGQPASDLYVMASGRAKAFHDTAEGQQVVVDLLGPGDLFGGVPALGHDRYPETVQALSTTCALRMDNATFENILGQFPPVALQVLNALAGQLRTTRSTLAEHHAAPVASRVAATLLRLADKFGTPSRQGELIQFPLSRADLAGITGASPESVSRAMSSLRKAGIIETGRRWTALTDRARLTEIAENY